MVRSHPQWRMTSGWSLTFTWGGAPFWPTPPTLLWGIQLRPCKNIPIDPKLFVPQNDQMIHSCFIQGWGSVTQHIDPQVGLRPQLSGLITPMCLTTLPSEFMCCIHLQNQTCGADVVSYSDTQLKFPMLHLPSRAPHCIHFSMLKLCQQLTSSNSHHKQEAFAETSMTN